MIKGIDVSNHQGKIDWAAVANDGIKFAIIRAGIGSRKNTPKADERFLENITAAYENGIAVGAYLYSYALDAAAAMQEADFMLSMLYKTSVKMTYPIVFDIEDKTQGVLHKHTISNMCGAFCERIAANGYIPAIYANLDWMNRKIDTIAKYDNWLAHWANKPGRTCDIWQYSDKGKVSGISTNVDMNISYKDYSNGQSQEPPAKKLSLDEDIKKYQQTRGLKADGLIGEKTWAQIKNDIEGK